MVAAQAASKGKDVLVYIGRFCEEVQTKVCGRSGYPAKARVRKKKTSIEIETGGLLDKPLV